jgi:hypothetical protein
MLSEPLDKSPPTSPCSPRKETSSRPGDSWPRSFSLMIEQPPTQADKRAFTQRGKVEERRQDETVGIDFPASEQTEATRSDPDSSDSD